MIKYIVSKIKYIVDLGGEGGGVQRGWNQCMVELHAD